MRVESDINKKLEIRDDRFDKPVRWKFSFSFSSSFSSSLISKLSTLIFQLSTLFLLSSCSEVLYLNIEQMLPPEVISEHAKRSVGVVNNFSQNNVVVANQEMMILPCNADTVKEKVALAFANADIMERVVVLDSLLYHPDSTTRHILTQAEVNSLCQKLNVEMIYSIEYACLAFNPTARFIARTLDAYLCARIYTPDRDSIAGTSVMDKETLDYWVNSTEEIATLAPQIPALLAKNAIEPYLPSWKERGRAFYHDRLCYALREAKVYVHEGNWAEAAKQWQSLKNSKLRNYRFMAAYNMALYYEMTDNIEAALASLALAEELSIKYDKNGIATQIADTTLLKEYRKVLATRKEELKKIEQYLRLIK